MKGQVEGQLTLFPADSPASRSPLPGSKEARKMTATSGRKWLGLSKNSGPLGLLEKMLLESLRWHSPIYYLNWKPVGIGQGHFLFQLALSEPDIGDTESRLWVTPNTMDYLPQRSPEALKLQAEDSRKGRKRPANLREQVNPETVKLWKEPKIWKTPVASDAANREMYVNSRGEPNLSGKVKLWPTPTQNAKNSTLPQSQMNRDSLVGDVMRGMFATPQARDYRTGQASRWEDKEHRSRNLNDQIAMYPTPTTGAGMCGGTGNFQQLKKLKEQGVISENERRNMSQGNGGQLNPYWVEWLMGFLPGWTEI